MLKENLTDIIIEEIQNTLASILSLKIENFKTIPVKNGNSNSFIYLKIEFYLVNTKNTVEVDYFIPAKTASLIEYLMLCGITDKKEKIDDEIFDAVKEIFNTICGSIATHFNNSYIRKMSFKIIDSKVINKKTEIKDSVKCNLLTSNNGILNFYIKYKDFKIKSIKTEPRTLLLKDNKVNEIDFEPISISKDAIINIQNAEFKYMIVKSVIGETYLNNNKSKKLKEGDIINLDDPYFFTNSYLEINGKKIKDDLKIGASDNFIIFNKKKYN